MARKKTAAEIERQTQKALNEAYVLLASTCGIKEGDEVKVLRNFKDNELGCLADAPDDEEISSLIGYKCEVSCVFTDGMFELDNGYGFPFFCLEKVENEKRIRLTDEYVAEIADDGTVVHVGCQTIEFSVVEELYNGMLKEQNKAKSKKK